MLVRYYDDSEVDSEWELPEPLPSVSGLSYLTKLTSLQLHVSICRLHRVAACAVALQYSHLLWRWYQHMSLLEHLNLLHVRIRL